MVDDDRPPAPGTARSVLARPAFRTVFLGMTASNVGTWMQAVVVAALAYEISHSAWFVGLVTSASFLPTLLFSLVGGAIADRFDRKRLLVWLSVEQLVGSAALAWIAAASVPSRVGILLAVFAVGTGAALQGPVFAALTTTLVPREDIPGVTSLNMVSWNGSRVIGPAVGGLLYASVGAAWVFAFNAVSFLLVIVAILRVDVPAVVRRPGEGRAALLLGGFSYLRHEPVAGRVVTVMVVYTTFCLVFISQMPVVAEENLGIAAKSATYGFLYAMLGVGAMVGALSISTFFAGRRLDLVARATFVGYGVSLTVLALLRLAVPAFAVTFVAGFFYFASTTSVSTIFQSRLDEEIRGRATAVWLLAAIGTAPIANLLGGWLIGLTSITTVMLLGAAASLALGVWADLRAPEVAGARSPTRASRTTV